MKREKKKAEKARKSEKIKKAKQSRKKDEKEAKKIRKEEGEKSAKRERSIEEKIQKELQEMEKKDREEEEKQQRYKDEDEKDRRKKEDIEWLNKVDASCAKLEKEHATSIANEEVLKPNGYDLNRVDVAAGRTGKIYKAKDTKNGTELYVKLIILSSVKAKVAEKLKESLKVVKYLKHNRHPNVVKIYDIFTTKEKVYIFMEITDGSFKTAIKGNSSDEATVRKWANNIADGILFLHSNGIAHQNILPENVLVDSQGTLKLAGFSMACMTFDPVGKTFTKQSPIDEYFPHYSPERIKDKYDPIKADIFSFGVLIIYFMIRVFPFRLAGSDKSKYPLNVQWKLSLALKKVQISPELKDLLTLLFDLDPEKRPHIREVIKKPWMTGESTAPVSDSSKPAESSKPEDSPKSEDPSKPEDSSKSAKKDSGSKATKKDLPPPTPETVAPDAPPPPSPPPPDTPAEPAAEAPAEPAGNPGGAPAEGGEPPAAT